jgi:hypothetical protein
MWITVSFWMKKLTEVLIRSFLKTQVPYVIQIEAHKTKKNKNFKPHVPKRCLTFFFFFFFLLLYQKTISNYFDFVVFCSFFLVSGCGGMLRRWRLCGD